jgi:hypothetical protein
MIRVVGKTAIIVFVTTRAITAAPTNPNDARATHISDPAVATWSNPTYKPANAAVNGKYSSGCTR